MEIGSASGSDQTWKHNVFMTPSPTHPNDILTISSTHFFILIPISVVTFEPLFVWSFMQGLEPSYLRPGR